jgi:hypothetical protein
LSVAAGISAINQSARCSINWWSATTPRSSSVAGWNTAYAPAAVSDVMSKALGIVYRTIATHLIHTAGHTHDTAHAGAITFIQRFGSALKTQAQGQHTSVSPPGPARWADPSDVLRSERRA